MSDFTYSDDQHANHLLSEHARKNRAMWEASSDSYEQRHALALSGEKAMAWGMWRIPEEELHILGEVAGQEMIAIGCGGGRWCPSLAGGAGGAPGGGFFFPPHPPHPPPTSQGGGGRLPPCALA